MSFLQTILGELEMISPDEIKDIPYKDECPAPPHNCEVLGIVEDVFARKVYFLAYEYARKAGKLVDSIKPADSEEEMQRVAMEIRKIQRKLTLLDELFWITVRDQLDCWEADGINVYGGWRVVKDSPMELSIGFEHFAGHTPEIMH